MKKLNTTDILFYIICLGSGIIMGIFLTDAMRGYK